MNLKQELEALISKIYGASIFYEEATREFRRAFLIHVLTLFKGNVCKACKALGIHRNTLSRQIGEFRIDIRQIRYPGRKFGPSKAAGQPAKRAIIA